MTDIYTLDKLDSIEAEAIRGSTAQKGIYVTPNLIRRFNGDGNTAIIFKRLLYCCEQWADEEGWFYQTADTVEQVVGLGYRALQRSVKRLEKMGLIEKRLAGMPYKTYYRVNLSAYLELIKQGSSFSTSDKTSLTGSDKTSSSTSKETCSDTSGQQVILSDPSNDKESDTYAADADFSPSQTPNEPRKERTDEQETETDADHPAGRDSWNGGLGIFDNESADGSAISSNDFRRRGHRTGVLEADPLMQDLERATQAKRAEAGGNPAVPPSAGGDDVLVDTAIACLWSNGPRKGSGTYRDMVNVISPVHADWGLHDMEIGEALDLVRDAAALFLQEKPSMIVYKYPSFAANYGHYLGRAQNGETAQRGPPILTPARQAILISRQREEEKRNAY